MDSPHDQSRSPESAPRASVHGDGSDDARTPADAFKNIGSHVSELKEYVAYLISAKIDAAKLTARNIAVYAVLGIIAGVVGVGILATATVLLLSGLAGAIGAMFHPDRPWAGALIVGFGVLLIVSVSAIVSMKILAGASRRRTLHKYETRKRVERETFGHDVQERAREHEHQKSQR